MTLNGAFFNWVSKSKTKAIRLLSHSQTSVKQKPKPKWLPDHFRRLIDWKPLYNKMLIVLLLGLTHLQIDYLVLSAVKGICKLAWSADHGWSDKAVLYTTQLYIELQLPYRLDIHTVDWKQSKLGYIMRHDRTENAWTVSTARCSIQSLRKVF